MPKAIFTDSRNNRTTGFARPGIYKQKRGSVQEIVHDGDTINVELDGNLGVRYLGIDTPEVSFIFPGASFVDLTDPRWNDFLDSAFDKKWGEYDQKAGQDFRSWMQPKLQSDGGSIHAEHAKAATDDLKRFIAEDMRVMKQTPDTFRYYLAFGFEVMDCLLYTSPSPRDS